jgi:hypothetical protein
MLSKHLETNLEDAQMLLRHFQEHRPEEWPMTTTLYDLQRELEADALLMQESDEDGEWDAELVFWNALDNHTFGRDWCEACDD